MHNNISLIEVATEICDYPDQPRTFIPPDYVAGLAENMRIHGQQVPVIGYFHEERFQLKDGGCRLAAARLAKLLKLLAMDLGKNPTRAEFLMAQASIDQHRQNLPSIDRARLHQSIMQENGWTARQLSESLQVSEATISRNLALLSLPAQVQQQINSGTLDPSKGYLISQEPDPAKQIELAKLAASMTREGLAKKVREKTGVQVGPPKIHARRISCPLPSGVSIVVSGNDLSIDDFINAVTDVLREGKKARDQGLDVLTFAAVMRDKAKAGGA